MSKQIFEIRFFEAEQIFIEETLGPAFRSNAVFANAQKSTLQNSITATILSK